MAAAKVVEQDDRGLRAPRARLGRVRDALAEPFLVAAAVFASLTAFVSADPTSRVTFSVAPFTDEIGNVVNARNLVQLGKWTTDQWNLHLVNLPFSLGEAAVFDIFGVGIVQARMLTIVCVSVAAGTLTFGMKPVVGRAWAAFAGLAFAFAGLVLFYGRLAFLEDLVVLGLVMGAIVLADRRWIGFKGGLFSGFWFAIAIGTKPSAAFAIAGILLALGLIWARRDGALRSWIAGSVAVIALAGLAWLLVVGLPNRNAVTIDVQQIWPPYKWNLTPDELVKSVVAYLSGRNDRLYGWILGPLIFLAGIGLLAIVFLRKRLNEAEIRVAVVAFAWALFGFGIVVITSYQPNRYIVPLVPSLAILAAIGWRQIVQALRDRFAPAGVPGSGDAATVEEPVSSIGARNRGGWSVPGLVMAAVFVVGIAPGAFWYANWIRNASHDLVAIQNRFADAVPAGEVVSGDGYVVPLFLMRSRAVTYRPGPIDLGPAFEQGVKWFVEPPSQGAPAGITDAEWAGREQVFCVGWLGGQECLYHLP